jgi:diguanylate cyclase (GGDEF)-like protein
MCRGAVCDDSPGIRNDGSGEGLEIAASKPVSVLLVGLGEAEATALASEDGFSVTVVPSIERSRAADVVVVALDTTPPLETIRRIRTLEPVAALVVVTEPEHAADGTVALHAGAEDHLTRDDLLPALLPRAIRYALATNRMRRELATVDELTALPTVRGFAPIAEHHLRMADRAGKPVVFVFVRVEDRDEAGGVGDELARDAAAVVLDSVRDSDVPGRIAPDTFCILLSGDADGAETTVLSRLVEAMALHDTRRDPPRSLKLSLGTARYEPGSGVHLAELLEGALRGLGRPAGA